MTQDDEPVDDGTLTGPVDGVAPPTLLDRARALWCQLVSGLG